MIVAIERNKFTYLYKYDEIRVDINQVIDKPIEHLKWMLKWDFNGLVQLFAKAIPIFEQDHEVIILEIDKSEIKIQDGIILSFNSILGIYPITKMGDQLLEGKINTAFIVEPPIFERCIEALRINRSMDKRRYTAEKLLKHYNLNEVLGKETILAIESSVKKNLLDKIDPQEFNTFLDHLIAYNTTPSFIPEGNIEHICKIGVIAIKYLGKQEEVFTNGPFYRSILKYKSRINNKPYLASYQDFISISDSELKSSYTKIVDYISKDLKGVEVFKATYFFLAYKKFINNNDNNIEGILNQIDNLIVQDKKTSAFVLSMLGYTFSFENIYEGLHKLFNAPLLKSTSKKKAIDLPKREQENVDVKQKSETLLESPLPPIENEEAVSVTLIRTKDETETPLKGIYEVAGNDADSAPNKGKKVSEPMDNYNTDAPQASNNNNEAKNLVDFEEQIANSTILTVQIFRSKFAKAQKQPKQKLWLQFLDSSFPRNDEEITLDSLIEKLDIIPELENKLFKSTKDKGAIKAFFNAHK
jgi:hypothetical protein